MLSLPCITFAPPLSGKGRWSRIRSPASGSTLITRAPRSVSIVVPYGAANRVASSSTVTPARGRSFGGSRPPAMLGRRGSSARARISARCSSSVGARRRTVGGCAAAICTSGARLAAPARARHRRSSTTMAVVDQLRVVEGHGAVAELLGEDVGVVVEDRDPLGERLRVRRVEHPRPQLQARSGVLEQRQPGPVRVGEHPLQAERLHQRGEEVRRTCGELQPAAVLGEAHQEHERERAGRHALVVEDAIGLGERLGPALGDQVLEPRPRVERGEALQQARSRRAGRGRCARVRTAPRGSRAAPSGGAENEREGDVRRTPVGGARSSAEGGEDTELGEDDAFVPGTAAYGPCGRSR